MIVVWVGGKENVRSLALHNRERLALFNTVVVDGLGVPDSDFAFGSGANREIWELDQGRVETEDHALGVLARFALLCWLSRRGR